MGSTCSTDTTSNQHETDPTVFEVVDDFTIEGNSTDVTNHILKPHSEDYELITIFLHKVFDEEKKIEVFNGIELEWKHSHTQETYQAKAVGAQFSNDTIMYEISNLDYIERIVWNQHDAIKSDFLTHFGVVPKLGKTQEVGSKGARTRALENKTTTEEQSELTGLELTQSCTGNQYFVGLKALWKILPESKRVTLPEPAASFFDYNRSVNLRVIAQQLAYLYRRKEDVYQEFQALIDTKNGTQEYLGALPVRFLSPEEKTRLDNAIKESNATNLLSELHSRKRFYKQLLPADIKKEVVSFCTELINKELQKTSTPRNLEEIADNIRFLNKLFLGIYNDDEELWSEVKTATAESLSAFNSVIFSEIIAQITQDPEIETVKNISDSFSDLYSTSYQKGCPQRVDKGTTTCIDRLIQAYSREARQILVEFHGTLRHEFGSRYIGAPVEESGKIKTRVQEFIKNDNLETPDAVARILDFVNGTIVCANGQEVVDTFNALQELCPRQGFSIVRVNNQFQDLESESFKAVVVNIVAYDCLICEVRITLGSLVEVKEIGQFIATLQREKSLYPVISDYLSSYNQFNNWLGPFLPESKKLLLPERYIRFKGFYYYKGPGEYAKRGYMDMKLCFLPNGDLTGYGVDPLGEFQIAGNHHKYNSFRFIKTMVNVPNPWSITYTGNFVDSGVLEGDFLVGDTDGHFRLYVGDYEYPALNPGLIRINLKDKAKKTLPEKELQWKGYYMQFGTQHVMTFNITTLLDGSITGNGQDDIDTFKIIGHHDQYKTFSFIKMMDGNSQHGQFSVNYEGFFVDNEVVEGKWNSGGFMGNFHIEVAPEEVNGEPVNE